MRRPLLIGAILVVLSVLIFAGCKDLFTRHNISLGNVLHGQKLYKGANNCTSCHGITLNGNGFVPSCYGCHDRLWDADDHTTNRKGVKHLFSNDSKSSCSNCHGENLEGNESIPSCYECHDDNWSEFENNHTLEISGYFHVEDMSDATHDCIDCHGSDLTGGTSGVSCFGCHGNRWEWIDHNHSIDGARHASGYDDPENRGCDECHGSTLQGEEGVPSCYGCHGPLWDPDSWIPHNDYEHGVGHARGMDHPFRNNCDDCHGADLRGGGPGFPSCFECHGNEWDEGDDHHGDDRGDDDKFWIPVKSSAMDYGRWP